MTLQRSLLVVLGLLGGTFAAHAQEVTVKVGTVRSISTTTILWAAEKGYFKQYGIKVVPETLETAANSIALLAQNQLQLVEGGISAGYFNALEKNLPVTMVLDRVSSPIGHNLMLRPDLKGQITQLRQLKGKTIATNGQGAVSTYEVGKMLETQGLTITDVEIKVIPFTQYALAFNNKAIDAAIVIPPFTAQLLDERPRGPLPRPRSAGQTAPDDDLGEHHQHRLGEGQSRAGAQLLRRLPARHPRLLPGLSTAADPAGVHRPVDPHAAPKPRRSCCTNIPGRRAARRPDQCREHARHAGLVREEQDKQLRVSGRSDRRQELRRFRAGRSSGRSCWRTRTARPTVAGDPARHSYFEKKSTNANPLPACHAARSPAAARPPRRSSTPFASAWCGPRRQHPR